MMRRIVLAVLLGLMIAGVCAADETQDARVVLFSYSHRGMSMDQIYAYSLRADDTGGAAEFEFYMGKKVVSLPAVGEDFEALDRIVAEHDLKSWNGFNRSDPRVLDGDGFELRILLEDGSEIRASGSNCRPEGFREAEQEFSAVFEQILNRNEIDPEAV